MVVADLTATFSEKVRQRGATYFVSDAVAVDRAHRIGQDKHVFVYRLLCRDTVEEKVATLQEAKRGLAESIINTSQSLVRDLDRETLEMPLS